MDGAGVLTVGVIEPGDITGKLIALIGTAFTGVNCDPADELDWIGTDCSCGPRGNGVPDVLILIEQGS